MESGERGPCRNKKVRLKSSVLCPGRGERGLLEQGIETDLDDLFDRDWIVEFRRSFPPVIGLTSGGSVENLRREAE
jgi:hypothetical protein